MLEESLSRGISGCGRGLGEVHMGTETKGMREIGVVLALALVGLLLAAAAALVPWRIGGAPAPVVGVEAPGRAGPAS